MAISPSALVEHEDFFTVPAVSHIVMWPPAPPLPIAVPAPAFCSPHSKTPNEGADQRPLSSVLARAQAKGSILQGLLGFTERTT